jgi:CheY-like chemotaxis protein
MALNKKKLIIENISILAVDDMKSMRLTIRKMLRHLNIGKDLKVAENGREGLAVLQSSPVDLVIVDWRMPVVNGSEMLEAIRSDKVFRDIPVIMVTAEAERDIVLEVAETEVDAYLIKPLTLDALDRKIRAVVHRVNNPDKATILIREARDLEEAGDLEAAIEKLKLALVSRPSASRLVRNLGQLYAKTGDKKTAIKCLQKAASVNKQDAISRQILGDMYIQGKDLKKAAQYYIEALSLSTKFADKAIVLGERLFMTGLKRQGIEIFSKIISGSKKNLADKQRIVDICLEQEEFEYANGLLQQIITEFPTKYDMVFKAAEVCTIVEDFDKALELFEIVDRNQGSRIDVKLKIAQIHYNNNKPYKAYDYLNQILRIDPVNAEALELRRKI